MLDSIPFEMPNSVPFVVMEAHAGAQPMRVLLDTGNASPYAMIVSPAAAARAGATAGETTERTAQAALGDHAVTMQGARLPSFALGPLALTDVPVAVSSAVDSVSAQLRSPLDAILGHQFVVGRTISIDYAHRQVDFSAAAGPEARALAFTIAPNRPVTLVRATINGHGPYLMVLDSGASTTLVSPEVAAAAGVETSQAAQLGGAGGTQAGGARVGRARITLGSLTRDGQMVAVADVLGPVRAAAGAPIDGILGADMFGAGRITLDYATNRFWYEEAREAN